MEPPPTQSVCLAVDLGAGSGRVIAGIFHHGALRLEEVHRFENHDLKLLDTWYWNTTGLYTEILRGLKKAASRFGKAVVSLGIDTWGVDYGLLDASGSLLGMPVQYRDSRTDGMMEKVFGKIPSDELYAATGNQFMFYNTLFQLVAEAERNPERLAAADKLLWMPDLFGYWLTGKTCQETSIASTAQLVNAQTGEWAWEVIDRLELPRKLFGTLTPPGTVLGELLPHVAEETGLKAKVISVGGHDTASAVAGTPLDSPNSVYLSSGTWSLLGILVPRAVVNESGFELAFTNEGGVENDIRLMKNLCGMWLIQECKKAWEAEAGSEISWETLIFEAEAAEPFASLLDPDHPELSSHGNMPKRIQEVCRALGEPVPETRGAMTRLIFESLALKYRVVVENLEELTHQTLGSFHIVGGGSRNILLNHFTANALNRPVSAGPVEATAAGNILMQMLADGTVADLSSGHALIRDSFDVQTILPDEPEIWEAQLPRFRALCTKV